MFTLLSHAFEIAALFATLSVVVWLLGEMQVGGLLARKAERVSVTRIPAPTSPIAYATVLGGFASVQAMRVHLFNLACERDDLERASKLSSARFASPSLARPMRPAIVATVNAVNAVNVRRERDALRSAALGAGLARVAATIARKASELELAREASDRMVKSARSYAAKRVNACVWSDGLTVLPVASKRIGEAAMQCGNVAMMRTLKGSDANGRKVYSYSLVY